MKLDLFLPRFDLDSIAQLARQAEGLGFAALWVGESAHNPFIGLALAATATERIGLGTDVAVAFARSPMLTAYAAWDLQKLSRGRFLLGLGPQVKAHNERRFSVPWQQPGPRMREVVLSLRAIWRCWQEGMPLDFRGRFYTFTLMTPMFHPGPIDHPQVPIYLAAVNRYMLRLCGELANGVHLHPLHTRRYLEELALPALADGLRRAGRQRSQLEVVVPVLLAVDREGLESARRQIAYYGSTPAYRTVFAVHGWEDLADDLRSLASQGRWGELEDRVPYDLVEQIAVVAAPERVGTRLQERYGGVADRVAIYGLPRPLDDVAFWRRLTGAL
jgi:probable F420-dependent oxidoreductase